MGAGVVVVVVELWPWPFGGEAVVVLVVPLVEVEVEVASIVLMVWVVSGGADRARVDFCVCKWTRCSMRTQVRAVSEKAK